ncbi:hypothetical protein CDCA_CDCA19G4745 [Cyanidium caldarium]|uniref:Phospholipid/glycerol acyltransferase domain-containing protein n=1 Tax=Cyanidium caldarium TaxID=2771 RepID=A0AAV9J2W7_CYACA|nr:hypothetical protein CDCA_CDCA19G4745 [Cyanidium caldarium]
MRAEAHRGRGAAADPLSRRSSAHLQRDDSRGDLGSAASLTRSKTRTAAALLRATESLTDLTGVVRGEGVAAAEREGVQERFERALMESLLVERDTDKALPRLVMPLPLLSEAVEDIVQDDFTRCFQRTKVPAWNWNAYLFVGWLVGVVLRYGILFPLRVLCILVGSVAFGAAMMVTRLVARHNPQRRQRLERHLIVLYSACWIMSTSGVIAYHGKRPRMRPHAIYVANHSSLIDLLVLQQLCAFATVGQLHGGLIGLVQQHVLDCLGCIWFSRDDLRDRHLVRRRIEQHLAQSDVPPLLIFPEGTCVNNEYCLMFKKGAFEIPGAVVYPVAIKYHKLFADAFWNSQEESFAWHMVRIWTSWALVADVFFLDPMVQGELDAQETPTEFAARVKQAICEAAGLKPVEIDGYYKRMQASDKYIKARRRQLADVLLQSLEADRAAAAAERPAASEPSWTDSPGDGVKRSRTTRF